MEDNAPDHDKDYHDLPQARLGLTKQEQPSNSPDLNLMETIWSEIKDKVKERLGWKITAKGIRVVIEDEWKKYPVERINHHIMSMSKRIEACIADGGRKNFNF